MRISDLKNIFKNAYGTYATLANGVRIYQLSAAITANVTTTTAPAGSIGVTSHATGRGVTFYSDGTKWQVPVTGATTKASGADIDTGTDDAKFATAKAIADSGIVFMATPATHIADPTGGATTDSQARTAIAAILDALETAGIVAAS